MKPPLFVVQIASVLALIADSPKLTDRAQSVTRLAAESVTWQYETGG